MENVTGMAGACPDPRLHRPQEIYLQDSNKIAASADASCAWFALIIHQYKREQCEQMLGSRGYEYFSPCFQTIKQWSDRRKHVDVPLFPGYIFCRFNPQCRLPLLQIPGVLGIVSSGKQFLEVDAKELDAIRKAMAGPLPVEPYPFMTPGQKVKVVHGPLRGIHGVLVRTKAESRLLLSVGILNRCVSVEVQASHLAARDHVADQMEIV
jgi:transcription termination/antitermination protein NusG